MTCKEYRKRAWDKLRLDWGKPILIFFIINLLSGGVAIGANININKENFGPEFIAIVTAIGTISGMIALVITGPFSLSRKKVALSISRDNEYETKDAFFGFYNFLSSLLLHVLTSLFILLWTLLLIIPGIIKALSYSMSFFILHDHPDMDANDAIKESMRIMEGHKWELFKLNLSFIGWILLSILTLGILFLWISPYIEVANAEFYETIKPIEDEIVEEINEDTIEEI